ncbi:MAG: PEGA domain-containing protein [Candidatus Omnitrophica bacterium]|nr:PEGA domain-containing protein [Candidatus Omnitrophota bacterium]
MKDKIYLRLRKLFFWLFFTAFIVLAPTLVFYSLGYKFNIAIKKFQKTGTVSVKCFPKEVEVYLDNKKINDSAPCTIRELLPNTYILRLEKEDFYSYRIPVEVKSSAIAEIDVMLMPKLRNVEKLPMDLNVYNFFIMERLFGKAIIIFSDKGIYLLSEDFENIRKLADLSINKLVLGNIMGVREEKNQFVFWSKNNIWLVKMPKFQDNGDTLVLNSYSAKEVINNVFFCLKGRYLIIHDGMKIIALDAKSPDISFPIMETRSITADVFYDYDADVLYVKDKMVSRDEFSLFKINLMELIHERKTQ